MSKDPVLLVDDDEQQLRSLSRSLASAGLEAQIYGASNPQKAIELALDIDALAAVIDLNLNEEQGVESGFSLLREIRKHLPHCRVIVLTGHGAPEFGIRALNAGAASFLEKPADSVHLAALMKDSIAQSKLHRDYLRLHRKSAEESLAHSIIGQSVEIKKVREEILYAASNDQAVFLGGETGTGKSACAQAIHDQSLRKAHSFVRYQPNFAGPDLVASELFGHLKGAFTGAEHARSGLIRQADRGTLFLDEIDALPLNVQAALLGVLQEKSFRAVGDDREQQVNFRLISACNQDLEQQIANDKLRADFVHRVAHYRLEIPALRNRLEDIPLLVEFALEQLRRRERVQVFGICDAALSELMQYDWPGNVRELLASIESAAYKAQFHQHSEIDVSDLHLQRKKNSPSQLSFHEQVDEYRIKLIKQALSEHQGNQVQAAKALGLDRSSMRRILARSGEI